MDQIPGDQMNIHEQFVRLRKNHRRDGFSRANAQLCAAVARRDGRRVFGAFADDYERAVSGTVNFDASRRAVYEALGEGVLLGILAAPYLPELGMEFAEGMVDDQALAWDHPAAPVPVRLHRGTNGLLGSNMVAVFLEHFQWCSESAAGAYTIYFPERFEGRFREFTMPVLRSTFDDDSWSPLSAVENQLEIVSWLCRARVTLHDWSHYQGVLPFPGSLSMKSTRSGATVEELRADLGALRAIETGRGPVVAAEMRVLLQQYILSQRLLYAVAADPAADYDARSSVLLLGWLERAGALRVRGNRLTFSRFGDLVACCCELLETIEEHEEALVRQSDDYAERRSALATFGRSLVGRVLGDGSLGALSATSGAQALIARRRSEWGMGLLGGG